MKKLQINILYIIILLLISGCMKPSPLPTITPVDLLATEIKQTATPSQTALPNPPTLTASPEPSATAIPLLSLSDARVAATNLLNTNGGCRLPCWWGITPGQSTMDQVFSVLQPLRQPGKEVGNGWAYYYGSSYFPTTEPPHLSIGQYYYLDGDIVDMIELVLGGPGYSSLDALLNEYGQPSEAYIRTFSNEYQGTDPFYLILFFEDKGILAFFGPDDAQVVEDTVQMCYQNEPIWGLVLWSPDNHRTYNEVVKMVDISLDPDEDHLPVLSLEDSTDLTLEEFYKLFKDASAQHCLETPVELWQGQFE